jgi:hypothetical protein
VSQTAEACLPLLGFALLLAPGILVAPVDGPPRSPDDDGGGGHGPADPPPRPRSPNGGIPLLDAEQSGTRVRDHGDGRKGRRRIRRPAREPQRAPVRI